MAAGAIINGDEPESQTGWTLWDGALVFQHFLPASRNNVTVTITKSDNPGYKQVKSCIYC